MEVKEWTYEEFPEFTEEVEGAHIIETTGDEPGVLYLNDVEYRTTGDMPLRLQLLIPMCRNRRFDRPSDEPAPALPCVVFVQGSAWMKQRIYGNVPNISRLAIRGFVCAIVEYRHSGIAWFPAQAVDALNAIRFLKQHAADFWIDPEKIILAGDSSGGHTAMWDRVQPLSGHQRKCERHRRLLWFGLCDGAGFQSDPDQSLPAGQSGRHGHGRTQSSGTSGTRRGLIGGMSYR